MEVIDLRDFVRNGMFRESEFRELIKARDWSAFQGKPVLVQGCAGGLVVPTWAYLVITAEVAPYAKSISYGEPSRPIPVYGKLGSPASA